MSAMSDALKAAKSLPYFSSADVGTRNNRIP